MTVRDSASRAAWVIGVMAILLLLLAGQLYRLTVVQAATLRAEAEQQMHAQLPSYGPRGAILDAKGRPLASSAPAFAAVLISQDAAAIEKMMPNVALLLAAGDKRKADTITARVMQQFRDHKENWRGFEPIAIERRLSTAVVTAFTERRSEFPGVILVQEPARHYPAGALGGALMGYVGAVTDEELKDDLFKDYNADELIGKAGLELYYERELRGEPGHTDAVIDYVGRRVGDFVETPPVPGNNLHLTLDMDLQKLAEESLSKQIAWIKQQKDPSASPIRGAAVVQDVRTGAILAMASVPTYDPNLLVTSMTDQQWEQLQSQPGFSMYNWGIQGLSPGSTFKMATGYAGLEAGVIGSYETIPCRAVYWRFGNPKNWKPYDDGNQDIGRALATSCNPYFWEVSYRLGVDKMHHYYDLLGFGKKTGIDLPAEFPGVNPSKEMYGDNWAPGSILNMAIGQGDTLVTPLQLANYVAAISMKGVRYQPYLVQEITTPSGTTVFKREPKPMETIPGKAETWARLRQGMWQSSNTPEGTAFSALPGFPITTGGKTGSAERGAITDATTVLFAPYDNPQIAVSVVIEGGSHGSWATPIARRLLAQYFGIKDVIPEYVPTYRD